MEEWEEEDRMQETEDRISRKQQYRRQNTPVKYAKAFHPDGIAQQKHSIGQAGQAGDSITTPEVGSERSEPKAETTRPLSLAHLSRGDILSKKD